MNSKRPTFSRRAAASAQSNWLYVQLENRVVLAGDVMYAMAPAICDIWNPISEDSQFDDQGRLVYQSLVFDQDSDGQGDLNTVDEFAYSDDGLTTNQVHSEDLGMDGSIESRFWSEQTLGANGQVASSLIAWDNDGDGNRDSQVRSSYTYDDEGYLVLLVTETDVDGDGTFDEANEETFDPTICSGGDEGGGDEGNGDGSGGDDEVPTWTIVAEETQADDLGRLIFQDISYDTDGDGLADYRTTDRYSYSEDGLTTQYSHQEDLGADGIIDSAYWSEQVFNADGQLAVSLEAWDHDGDGQNDLQTRATWTFDETGLATRVWVETDHDGDGTYDESVEHLLVVDGSEEEPGDYRVETEEELDDQGRVLRVTHTHYTADQITSRETSAWTYNANGTVATFVQELDHDADGRLDYRSLANYEWNSESELAAIHYQIDEDGDGTIDSSYTVDPAELGGEWYAAAGGEFQDGLTGTRGEPQPVDEASHSLNLSAVGISSDSIAENFIAAASARFETSSSRGPQGILPSEAPSIGAAGDAILNAGHQDRDRAFANAFADAAAASSNGSTDRILTGDSNLGSKKLQSRLSGRI